MVEICNNFFCDAIEKEIDKIIEDAVNHVRFQLIQDCMDQEKESLEYSSESSEQIDVSDFSGSSLESYESDSRSDFESFSGESSDYLNYTSLTIKCYPNLNVEDGHSNGVKEDREDRRSKLPGSLKLKRSFGVNSEASIIYLKTGELVYASSNVVNIVDYKKREVRFKSGFNGKISQLTNSESYMAACDRVSNSDECAIMVWSLNTLKSVQCWLIKVPGGITLLQFLTDGRSLVAVSSEPQFSLFVCKVSSELVQTTFLPRETPVHINACLTDSFVLTYSTKIVLVTIGEKISFKEVNQSKRSKSAAKVGVNRKSEWSNCRIITGTSLGVAVITTEGGRHEKIIRLANSGVNYIKNIGDVLFIGFDDGNIFIYEQDLKFKRRVLQLPSAIRGISFRDLETTKLSEWTFITCCGTMGMVSNGVCQLSVKFPVSNVLSMACHPTNGRVLIGYAKGEIVLYNLVEKCIQQNKCLDPSGITAVAFSSMGTIVGIGTECGRLIIMDAVMLTLIAELASARTAITHIVFKQNRNGLAYSHREGGVALYKNTVNWYRRGKLRAHNSEITGVSLFDDKLYTIGQDRILAELDTKHMLRLLRRYQLPVIPISILHVNGQLLLANSDQKLHFFDTTTKRIVQTVRCPGNKPISSMGAVANTLVFSAGRGIGACPLPWRGWGNLVAAHPSHVTRTAITGIGGDPRVITAARDDSTILIWSINDISPLSKIK